MQNFFAKIFNLHNPSPEMISQFTLSTSHSGMGILQMTTTAPAADLASLRNLLSEFMASNPTSSTSSTLLANWAFEDIAKRN